MSVVFVLSLIFLTELNLHVPTIKCENEPEHGGWQFFNYEECGGVTVETRITRGQVSSLGQYPWMARLGYERSNKEIEFRCGGALINPNYVLTAGHCIHGWKNELKIVRLGEHFLNTTEDCENDVCAPPVQDIPTETLHLHEGFDRNTTRNDIALIRLAEKAAYNDFVKPICIPRGEILKKNFVAQYVEVAGWGVTNSESLKKADTLLHVKLPVRDSCACNDIVPGGKVDDTQFCVGLGSGEDSCSGDSGGPMMKLEEFMGSRKFVVLGVVSVGKNYCGESPAVYTNVIKYLDWILETVCIDEGVCNMTHRRM